jgi:hypothetical protein
MEWFDLGEEPYFEDLCDGVPSEFRVDCEIAPHLTTQLHST